jgi:hypothetical protein
VRVEWHLLLPKAVPHIAFRLPSAFHEASIGFGSSFSSARLVSVGSVGDPVDDNRVEQLLVQDLAEGRLVFALESNHRLEGFECLDHPLEADRSWLDAVPVAA